MSDGNSTTATATSSNSVDASVYAQLLEGISSKTASFPPEAQLAFALLNDVASAGTNAAKDAYSRRAYVRSVFSLIETLVFLAKKWVLRSASLSKSKYTIAEYLALHEIGFEVAGNGVSKSVKKFIRLESNVKFTAKMLLNLNAPKAKPDYDSQGWSAFLEALKVRHRLTHPKTFDDIQVSDADFKNAEDAFYWFLSFSFTVVATVIVGSIMAKLDSSSQEWIEKMLLDVNKAKGANARPVDAVELREAVGLVMDKGGIRDFEDLAAILEKVQTRLNIAVSGTTLK